MAEMITRVVHVGCFDETTDAYQMPRLVRLAPNLFGACFTLMKMNPARFILRGLGMSLDDEWPRGRTATVTGRLLGELGRHNWEDRR